MISKQEGGTEERWRLRLPGEQGDWAARARVPSLPGSLWLHCPGGELLLPGSWAPKFPWDQRGAGVGVAAPNTDGSLEYWSHLWRVIGWKRPVRHEVFFSHRTRAK